MFLTSPFTLANGATGNCTWETQHGFLAISCRQRLYWKPWDAYSPRSQSWPLTSNCSSSSHLQMIKLGCKLSASRANYLQVIAPGATTCERPQTTAVADSLPLLSPSANCQEPQLCLPHPIPNSPTCKCESGPNTALYLTFSHHMQWIINLNWYWLIVQGTEMWHWKLSRWNTKLMYRLAGYLVWQGYLNHKTRWMN